MLRRILLFTLSVMALAIQIIHAAQPVSKSSSTGIVVLGKVSDKPLEKIAEYKPLAEYLTQHLQWKGITACQVKVARDIETMTRWMAAGEVDIFFDNPYASLLVGRSSGGQPALLRIKEGAAEKRAVFFALAEDAPASLAELKGRMIALESKESSAGFLLPMAHMLAAGLRPVEKPHVNAPVAPDEVGYVFSKDDDNTVQWVFSRKTVAGVIERDDFKEVAEENSDALSILAETDSITRHQLGIISSGLHSGLRDRIIALLTGLNEVEGGRAYLEPSGTLRFEEATGRWKQTIDRIESLYDLVHF